MIRIKGIYVGADYATWLDLFRRGQAPRWGVLCSGANGSEFLFALDEYAGLPIEKLTEILSTQNPGAVFSLCDGRKEDHTGFKGDGE